MKAFIIILLCSVSLGITGCKKSVNGKIADGADFIKAKVDGRATATIAQGGQLNKISNFIMFSGTSNVGNGDRFLFSFAPRPGFVGTYPINQDSNFNVLAQYASSDTDPDQFYSSTPKGSGSLQITSFEGNVLKGTFQFKANNQSDAVKTISEGSFQVKLEIVE